MNTDTFRERFISLTAGGVVLLAAWVYVTQIL